MKHVYAAGEILIDFVCSDIDVDLADGEHFIKKPGGAPANVCAVIGKLGGKASFIGRVGADAFGDYLLSVLHSSAVDTSMCQQDSSAFTTLAFVSLNADGERDFCFSRGADEKLQMSDIDDSIFLSGGIFHFGSATGFLGGKLTDTYLNMLKQASEAGMLVSFDPNFRSDLWNRRENDFIVHVKENLHYADIAKFSEEELSLVSGMTSVESALSSVHSLGVPLILVTMGSRGALISRPNEKWTVPGISVKSIDSTGAGDAFVGALLFRLAQAADYRDIIDNAALLKDTVFYANCVGALVCTRYGAISAIPLPEEIERIMQ